MNIQLSFHRSAKWLLIQPKVFSCDFIEAVLFSTPISALLLVCLFL